MKTLYFYCHRFPPLLIVIHLICRYTEDATVSRFGATTKVAVTRPLPPKTRFPTRYRNKTPTCSDCVVTTEPFEVASSSEKQAVLAVTRWKCSSAQSKRQGQRRHRIWHTTAFLTLPTVSSPHLLFCDLDMASSHGRPLVPVGGLRFHKPPLTTAQEHGVRCWAGYISIQ